MAETHSGLMAHSIFHTLSHMLEMSKYSTGMKCKMNESHTWYAIRLLNVAAVSVIIFMFYFFYSFSKRYGLKWRLALLFLQVLDVVDNQINLDYSICKMWRRDFSMDLINSEWFTCIMLVLISEKKPKVRFDHQ